MKNLLLLLFILLIPILGYSLFLTVVQIDFTAQHIQFFFGAVIISIIIHYYRTRKKPSFFATFEHELTHNIWALFTFNKPAGFHINNDGTGMFEYYGKSNFLQMLGPYVTLTISYILIPFYYILIEPARPYYFLVLGLATGYHTASTIKETGFFQTDIKRQGYLFSMVFIIIGNIFSYGLLLAFVINRHTGMWEFLNTGFIQAWELLQVLRP